jgi:hypothetical protein
MKYPLLEPQEFWGRGWHRIPERQKYAPFSQQLSSSNQEASGGFLTFFPSSYPVVSMTMT